MTNLLLIFCLIALFTIVQVVLILIYKEVCGNSRDEYVISMSTLERVISDYVTVVLTKEIQSLRKDHNLNPESKLNSIIAFEKKVNDVVSESSYAIMKMLAPKTLKTLQKRFSNNSLALLIINKIKQELV